VDPLAGKYLGLSPYVYTKNTPVNAFDPDGKDVIVLSNPDGANFTGHAYGHAAVLIGNSKEGWGLYSKNGGSWGIVGTSKHPQYGQKGSYFPKIEDFYKYNTSVMLTRN